jgi:hypothetical protein
MDIGIRVIPGYLLGVKYYMPTDDYEYNEFQIHLGFVYLYFVWD